MKKLIGLITVLFIGLASLNAMSYEEARDRARYLTDKMAYELNLNEQQYNDAYEINLDYLMNIRTESDATGVYLEYRNADLRFILYDWQYALFRAADYFFRPVLWRAGAWFFPVYGIYRVNRFFYAPPRVYHVYHGGNWAYHRDHRGSFYAHRRPLWNGGLRGESRGPAPRPEHMRRPEFRNNAGFRFEPVTRPQRPNEGRQPDKGPGFHFGPVTHPETSPRPQHTQRQPTSVKEPGRTGNSNRKPAKTPLRSSNYNRPSSTRTTVNQESKRPAAGRTRVQTGRQRATRQQVQSRHAPQRQAKTTAPTRSGRR